MREIVDLKKVVKEVREAVCGPGLAATVRKEFHTKGTPFYLGFSWLTVTSFWTQLLNLSGVGLVHGPLCLLSYTLWEKANFDRKLKRKAKKKKAKKPKMAHLSLSPCFLNNNILNDQKIIIIFSIPKSTLGPYSNYFACFFVFYS